MNVFFDKRLIDNALLAFGLIGQNLFVFRGMPVLTLSLLFYVVINFRFSRTVFLRNVWVGVSVSVLSLFSFVAGGSFVWDALFRVSLYIMFGVIFLSKNVLYGPFYYAPFIKAVVLVHGSSLFFQLIGQPDFYVISQGAGVFVDAREIGGVRWMKYPRISFSLPVKAGGVFYSFVFLYLMVLFVLRHKDLRIGVVAYFFDFLILVYAFLLFLYTQSMTGYLIVFSYFIFVLIYALYFGRIGLIKDGYGGWGFFVIFVSSILMLLLFAVSVASFYELDTYSFNIMIEYVRDNLRMLIEALIQNPFGLGIGFFDEYDLVGLDNVTDMSIFGRILFEFGWIFFLCLSVLLVLFSRRRPMLLLFVVIGSIAIGNYSDLWLCFLPILFLNHWTEMLPKNRTAG